MLRWEEQKRRKRGKKTKLYELMVSIPIPNHTIQFWIQFKTSGSYLQGLERWDPHHLSNHMTTFTPCLLIHWLTMLSVPRLFLKALRKGNFFIAVKGQKDRLLFSISKHSFEILLSPDPIFFFFLSKSRFTVHRHSVKICNDWRFHFTLEIFSTSSLFP